MDKGAREGIKRRYNNFERMIHWELYEKYRLKTVKNLYGKTSANTIENDKFTILWNVMVQYDYELFHGKPESIKKNEHASP